MNISARPQPSSATNNILAANIRPCNRHLVLKQCSSFSQSFYPSFDRTMLEQVVQTNSVCQRIRNIYLQFNCSSNLARKFVSFDWRVHQAQSNNWLSCNARISMVKAQTLFEHQLEIAWSNIACKRVNGLWPRRLMTGFLNWRPRIEFWQAHWSSFVMLSIFFFFLIFLSILLKCSVL